MTLRPIVIEIQNKDLIKTRLVNLFDQNKNSNFLSDVIRVSSLTPNIEYKEMLLSIIANPLTICKTIVNLPKSIKKGYNNYFVYYGKSIHGVVNKFSLEFEKGNSKRKINLDKGASVFRSRVIVSNTIYVIDSLSVIKVIAPAASKMSIFLYSLK